MCAKKEGQIALFYGVCLYFDKSIFDKISSFKDDKGGNPLSKFNVVGGEGLTPNPGGLEV